MSVADLGGIIELSGRPIWPVVLILSAVQRRRTQSDKLSLKNQSLKRVNVDGATQDISLGVPFTLLAMEGRPRLEYQGDDWYASPGRQSYETG